MKLKKAEKLGDGKNVQTNGWNHGKLSSLIYAPFNRQVPVASSACPLIAEGMIYALTQREPEMMDGVCFQ